MSFRVLIADDHELLRMGIKAMLSSQDDLEVVGEARDGAEAVSLCRRLHPDLVLMDLSMPEMDGIEATRAIKEEFPRTGVLVLTAHVDHGLLLEAVRAGAAGYVLKGVGPDQLLEAVRGVLGGESSLDQELVMQLVRQLAEEIHPQAKPPSSQRSENPESLSGASLTTREVEVLEHLAAGRTNRQIARELHLSLSTVKGHLERVISKLGVSDRTQAAVKAIELGLVEPERGG